MVVTTVILSGCSQPAINSDVDDLRSEVSELKGKVDDLESKVSDLEDEKDTQESKISELEDAVGEISTRLNIP